MEPFGSLRSIPDDEALQRPVAVRRRADEERRRPESGTVGDGAIRREDVGDVEHPDTECAMCAVKHERTLESTSGCTL